MLSRGYSPYKSMNIIIDQSEGKGALWLGDYPAAMNQKLQKQNNIKTILTIAGGLNVKPDSDILHKVYNISDILRRNFMEKFSISVKPFFILENTALCNIQQIWGDTFQRIEEGLKRGGVLVHCRAGVSRSASIVEIYEIKFTNLLYSHCISDEKIKYFLCSGH